MGYRDELGEEHEEERGLHACVGLRLLSTSNIILVREDFFVILWLFQYVTSL